MDILQKITSELLEALEVGQARFLTNDKPEVDRAFFEMVKKEVDPIFQLLEEWGEEVSIQIKSQQVPLHPQQIETTKENMLAFMLHSFYKDTRKRKFMEIYKSCYYVFIRCLKEEDA